MTKQFEGEFIREMLYSKGKVLVREIIDHSRWEIDYKVVFQHEGKIYSTCYSVGATEQQETEWPDSFECTEVEPFEKTVTDYRPVTTAS